MKFHKAFALVVVIILLVSCNNSDDSPEEIVYMEINKTIILQKPDSIEGTCKNLIFEIIQLSMDNFVALIRLNDDAIPCDGFNNILIDPTTKKADILEENQTISASSSWGSANGVSLEDFAGKGEKYIGYRSGSYPLSNARYNYGWIKISLTEDQKTLTIISRGTNYIDNSAIKAGQR